MKGKLAVKSHETTNKNKHKFKFKTKKTVNLPFQYEKNQICLDWLCDGFLLYFVYNKVRNIQSDCFRWMFVILFE